MEFKTTKKERIGYFLFCLGFPVFNNFVGGYVSLFMTDSGIAAAVVAAILGVAQIWDGVNDPAFGALVDLKPFKSGKYKPWTKLAPIVMPALTMILFALPLGMPVGWKIAWAAVFYILYTTAYDIGDVPIFGVIGVMTDDITERNFLTGRRNLAGVIIIAVVTVVAPPLYSTIGWAPTAVIMSLLGGALMWPFHKTLTERIEPAKEEKITIKRMFSAVLKNRYLLIFYLAVVICEITNTTQSILPYCARYLLGSDTYTTVLYITVLFPTLFFALFMPQLTSRIDKFILLLISVAGCFVTSIISYFVGYESIVAVCVMMFIRGIFFGPLTILLYVFTVDMIEYGHFRNGERVEGLAFSFQTFCAKAASGITSTVMMLVLSAFGFLEGATLDQPASAYTGMWLLFTLIPAIGYGLSLIVFSLYKLRDKDVQIMTKANVGEISRDEAIALLGERYS